MESDISTQNILGQSSSHIIYVDEDFCPVTKKGASFGLNKAVLSPLTELKAHAERDGFNLTVASGYRDFDRQLSIFNRKVNGELPVIDKNNQVVSISTLSPTELLAAIMYFSALPGASRHHWGTDFDFYDKSLLPDGKSLELAPWEYQNGGYFFELSQWLEANAMRYGFYRPYDKYRGGVAAEPWHYSYYPLANTYQSSLSVDLLIATYHRGDILLKDEIIDNMNRLYEQYVINVANPPYV